MGLSTVRSNLVPEAAADFDRPLRLTPGEDLAGWALGLLGRAVLFCLAAVSVAAVALIFAFIVKESWAFFAQFGVAKMLGSARWYPKDPPVEYGALALAVGSMYVTAGAMLLAVPVGLMTAVFLSDVVPFGVRQVIKPVVEVLAAIPSVAYGFFALMIVAPFMQDRLGFVTGANILNASILLAIMAIPTTVSVAEDSLTAIGRDIREAAYSLGATRAEAIVKVVMPAAHNGVLAAVILGIMRAVGETMVVWMAAGNAAQVPSPWWDLSQSVKTMTAAIAGEMGEAPAGGEHRQALFAVGLLLLVFTFLMNGAAELLMRRFRKAAEGAQGP